MFCSKCGKKNPNNTVYCSNCGVKIGSSPKEKVINNLKEKTPGQVEKAKIEERKKERMFSDLTDFSKERLLKQAVGFYLFYLVVLLLGSMLLAEIISVLAGKRGDFWYGYDVGTIVASVTCFALSFLVMRKKNLYGAFSIIIAIIMGAIGYYLGGIVGLLPVAFLTTRDKK